MRINKLLSNYGYCSRKEANRWIQEGRVMVDGVLCTAGQWVEPEQDIRIDGENACPKPLQYLKYHKPVGVLSTMEGQSCSLDQVLKLPFYAFPVGRLDKDSEGVLFITNDGDLANLMIAKDNHCEKVYIVTVNEPISEVFLEKMRSGVQLGTTITEPCYMKALGERQFEIRLKQGLNRQIRRMCTALGFRVERLVRISFGSILLEGVANGECAYLTPEEIGNLKAYLYQK